MRTVRIAELKDQLSKYLRAVEQGEEVEVMDRDRPIARLVPVPDDDGVVLLPPTRSFSSVRRRRYRPANWGVSSTDLLHEERQRR